MDINIILDRSEFVKERIKFMKSFKIPPLSDAKSNLGPCLAKIVFDQCNSALKNDFGLIPLKGTGDELWVSPSDLLIGKVALTPPLTSKHIQALTHEGIVRIGEQIEEKFWNETILHEENYFDARKKHILDEFEEFYKVEARNIELRERQYFQHQNDLLVTEFNQVLAQDLSNLEKELKIEEEQALKLQKLLVDREWKQKFKATVDSTVQELTEEFLNEMERQKSILINNFKFELQKAHMQRGFDINMEKVRCKESLKQLKHNLECKNIANMMYILCMERRKCCQEKGTIEQQYINEIKKLNKVISNKDEWIKALCEEKNKKEREINLREACLLEIIRHFQKFINFALRAAPTQAEFLLSIEKMMAFELTNTALKSKYSRLKHCTEFLPWKDEKKSLDVSKHDGLEIQDHHNCFKELTPTHEEVAGVLPEDLPAFNYKNKLYVREDFRNMVSQGIEITKSDELWSKDVEILIQTLRKSVSHLKEEEPGPQSISHQSSVSGMAPKSIGASSVQFLLGGEKIQEKPRKSSVEVKLRPEPSRKFSEERRGSLKPNYNSLQNINFEQIGRVEEKPALIATTNSVELIKKRGSIKPLKRTKEVDEDDAEGVEEEEREEVEQDGNLRPLLQADNENQASFNIIENRCSADNSSFNRQMRDSRQSSRRTSSPKSSVKDSLALDTRDSIIMKKTSLLKKSTEFNVTPKDSVELCLETKFDMKRKSSKLVMAKNSLELIRESMVWGTDSPLTASPTKEPPKQKLNMVCAKSKCNEKCLQTKGTSEVNEPPDVRKDSAERSIKMSHIEFIQVSDSSRDANVSINTVPTVYDTGSATYSTDLKEMYKTEPKVKQTKKKKATPAKDKFLDLPKSVKVVGDVDAREHLQTIDTFTEERIHSLIELIKDNPTLLRTFTACRR